jgi:flagellar biogenesis protein FliO
VHAVPTPPIVPPPQDVEPAWAEIPPAPAAPARTISVDASASQRRIGGGPSEPSLGAVTGWTLAVVALIALAATAARRFLRVARLGGDDTIRVAGRRAIGPRQELLVVETRGRAFLIGATRDRLTTLGDLGDVAPTAGAAPAESAQAAESGDAFRAALRKKLAPAEPSPLAEVAGELADIRRTVEGWRA